MGEIQDYNKAIELDPKNSYAYYYRGMIKVALGQRDSGCLDLSKAGQIGLSKSYEAIKLVCS